MPTTFVMLNVPAHFLDLRIERHGDNGEILVLGEDAASVERLSPVLRNFLVFGRGSTLRESHNLIKLSVENRVTSAHDPESFCVGFG